jgi:hypothetical protein
VCADRGDAVILNFGGAVGSGKTTQVHEQGGGPDSEQWNYLSDTNGTAHTPNGDSEKRHDGKKHAVIARSEWNRCDLISPFKIQQGHHK